MLSEAAGNANYRPDQQWLLSPAEAGLVTVAVSGGVDSAIALWLLQLAGYELQAMFMKNWEEDDTPEYCHAENDRADAAAICDLLGVELTTVNCSAEYWDEVFCEFLHEYAAGNTPNPDVLCNSAIKFKAFADHAKRLGSAVIATGHYARTGVPPTPTNATAADEVALLISVDPNKDQTYFLHRLDQSQLSAALFPLAGLTKPQVRALARDANLPVHAKPDSTGLCFIGKRPFKSFLGRYLRPQPGPILDYSGRAIGRHDGLMFYTTGQRRGLTIGGIPGAAEARWYVADKDRHRNALIVVQDPNHPALLSSQLQADRLHWIRNRPPDPGLHCLARIRHRQPLQPCVVDHTDRGQCTVYFKHPQRAVASGQYVVFYREDECLGGARICQGSSE